MALSESSPNFNFKINLGESSLIDYINKSVYEEIKQERETNEILNHLRMKYLPNSIRSNSFNKSMNVTYLNRNHSNKLYSTFIDKNSYIDNNDFPKTTHASFNKFNLMNNKVDLKIYKDEKILPYSLLEQKDSYNFEENKQLNNENINKENKKENEYSNNYLKQENNNLINIIESYKIIISLLIEYLNQISNYFSGQNTIDMNYINRILKANNNIIDKNSLNNLKSRLKTMKNNIFNFNILKKSQTAPITNVEKNIITQKYEPIRKEKIEEKNDYRPIIFERNNPNLEKMSKSVDKGGIIRRAKTWLDRIPKTYWSLNKKVKFRENKFYKV